MVYTWGKLGSAPVAALTLRTCMFGAIRLSIVVVAVTWRLLQEGMAVLCRGWGWTARLLLAVLVHLFSCARRLISVVRWLALRLCRRLTFCRADGLAVSV